MATEAVGCKSLPQLQLGLYSNSKCTSIASFSRAPHGHSAVATSLSLLRGQHPHAVFFQRSHALRQTASSRNSAVSCRAVYGINEATGEPWTMHSTMGEVLPRLPWVNQLKCEGKACSNSCVEWAPHIFSYPPGSDRAEVRIHNFFMDKLHAGPRNTDFLLEFSLSERPARCIHFVTFEQQMELRLLQKWIAAGNVVRPDLPPEYQELLSKYIYQNSDESR